MKKTRWILFLAFAILIGLYPFSYLFINPDYTFLNTKSDELRSSVLWQWGFNCHIYFGGLALMIGWTQFSNKWRNKYVTWHRNIGKIYLISVLISGICGVGIGFFANGGWISELGFISLGIIWLTSSALAYIRVRQKNFIDHEYWMIFSYAACFAAVTLRIWLPLLTIAIGDFIPAYRIVAWLCWVPNVLFAWWLVRKRGLV